MRQDWQQRLGQGGENECLDRINRMKQDWHWRGRHKQGLRLRLGAGGENECLDRINRMKQDWRWRGVDCHPWTVGAALALELQEIHPKPNPASPEPKQCQNWNHGLH